MTLPAAMLEPYRRQADALACRSPAWLAGLRRDAMERLAGRGLPSPREEEWKYTNVTPIERKRFPLAEAPGEVDTDWIKAQLLPGCSHLVFVDGHLVRDLSPPARNPDALLCDLGEALQDHADLLAESFGRAVDADHGFIDFNTALLTGGVLIRLGPATRLEQPIQILHLRTQEVAVPTRHLILLEEGAEATVIETHAGRSAGLTAHVGEVLLGRRACLNHYKIQAESDRSFHFGGLYVRQADGSRFHQTHFALGSLSARSEIHVRLEQGCEAVLDGFHWADGRRHLDSHTRIEHAAPAGKSRETYKAIAEQRGRSVFQGRIVVHPGAQQTDAAMTNRNLLLSDDAEVDSKPQLEIYADDVRCSHGVTVGQLDPGALFYLETRGIGADAARQLLIYGFVNELIGQVAVAALRDWLHRQLDCRFNAIDLKENP